MKTATAAGSATSAATSHGPSATPPVISIEWTMPSPDQTEAKPVILEPQPHGGALLRSAGPGRPKSRDKAIAEIRQALFSEDPDAPSVLRSLVGKALKGDMKAIELCLHYGIGKPTDKLEVSGPDGAPISYQQAFDDHERRALRDAIRRAGEMAPEPVHAGGTEGT